MPATGEHFYTWDPVLRRSPDRGWRRYGSDRLVRLVLRLVDAYAAAHPAAPRVGIGDLSRPHGGDFGVRYGWPGHVSRSRSITHGSHISVDVYCAAVTISCCCGPGRTEVASATGARLANPHAGSRLSPAGSPASRIYQRHAGRSSGVALSVPMPTSSCLSGRFQGRGRCARNRAHFGAVSGDLSVAG